MIKSHKGTFLLIGCFGLLTGNDNALTTNYTYNVRSWIKTLTTGTLFNQTLYYNESYGGNTPCYNGNISAMSWKASGDTGLHGYRFRYDRLSRLTSADYLWNGISSTNYSTSYTYNKQSNITSLRRNGRTGASSYGLIDNLTFTLDGNKLTRTDDAATASAYNGGFEFKDAVKQADEYAYDKNGNMTKDLNKNITDIQYNCLNLPSKVTFKDGSTITYTYALNGTKLRTVHKIGNTTTTTDYCGNVVYENGVQKLLLTDAGYVTLSDKMYHYYLQDHQGNNRVVANQVGQKEEVNHYYPFGGTFASADGNVQAYKYNGKELDTKKGVNWYDYGARMYDVALGRFMTIDRFTEKYNTMSPYQYGGNNPVNNIDINGDSIIIQPNANGLIDQIKEFFGFDTKYQEIVKADLSQLKKDDAKVSGIISDLEESENIHSITMPKDKRRGNFSGIDKSKADEDVSQGTTIGYDPYKKTDPNGESRTPRVGLSHELRHSYDADKGIMTQEETENGVLLIEVRAINTENKIRMKTGDPKRTKYGKKEIPKALLE